MHLLSDTWILYYHALNDTNYDSKSYKMIIKITTVEDFGVLYKKLSPTLLSKGMFFLMKNDIKPMWESAENINGGCYSFKVNNENIQKGFIELSMAAAGGWLTIKEKDLQFINGVSMSPKKHCIICKIWAANTEKVNFSLDIPFLDGKYIFNPHCKTKIKYESHNSKYFKIKN